jgi:hypothetical protein
MEIDAVFAAGASYFARERHGTASDPHISHTCTNCGAYSIVNMVDNHVYCPKCKTGKYVAKHLTCFSATIFMNTVPALGVMPRLGVSFVDIPDDDRIHVPDDEPVASETTLHAQTNASALLTSMPTVDEESLNEPLSL